MASHSAQKTTANASTSVRLSLSGKDLAAFNEWCSRTEGTKAWMVHYMVRYFLRTIPPGSQLPALPNPGDDPQQQPLL